MARARVFLKPGGPISKQVGARKFEGSAAHVMTDAAEIFSFKCNPLFIVEYLEGDPEAPPKSDPKASKAKKGKPAKPAKSKRPVEDEPEDDDEDEEDDEADNDGPDLSDERVEPMTKAQLVELAAELEVDGVDVSMKKDDIIARLRTANKE